MFWMSGLKKQYGHTAQGMLIYAVMRWSIEPHRKWQYEHIILVGDNTGGLVARRGRC
jgi:hypothetical protein